MTGTNIQNLHLWIVDDSPDVCLVLRELLIHPVQIEDLTIQFNSQTFHKASQFLQQLAVEKPALIILDYHISAENILTSIKHIPDLPPIIMMSGVPPEKYADQICDLPVGYCLNKPFSYKELMQAFKQILS